MAAHAEWHPRLTDSVHEKIYKVEKTLVKGWFFAVLRVVNNS